MRLINGVVMSEGMEREYERADEIVRRIDYPNLGLEERREMQALMEIAQHEIDTKLLFASWYLNKVKVTA